jgi:hypothetical protein
VFLWIGFGFFLHQSEHIPQTVQTELNQDTFSFHNDIIIKPNNRIINKIVLTPDLACLSKEVRTTELFYSSLDDDDELVDDGTFLEYDLVCFVVAGFHVFEHMLFVFFYQPEKLLVLLKSVFHVVAEHHLAEDVLPDYFC